MLRLLADENFPGDVVKTLTWKGHEVAWIRKDAPGVSDEEVLKRAMKEKRILITFINTLQKLVFLSKLFLSLWFNQFQCPYRLRTPSAF